MNDLFQQLQVNGMAQFAAEQFGLLDTLKARDAKIFELEQERALMQDEMHVLNMNVSLNHVDVHDILSEQNLS